MLVKADKVLTKIRLRLADMQKVKYADYELLSAMNDARSMLWIAFAENFSSIPQKTIELTLTDGVGPLPDDYYSLVSLTGGVVDGMTVVGMTVVGGDTANLVYNSVPMPVETDGDFDFPLSFMLDLVEIASAIVQGNTDAAVQIAMTSAKRVSQKREYSSIPDTRHFS